MMRNPAEQDFTKVTLQIKWGGPHFGNVCKKPFRIDSKKERRMLGVYYVLCQCLSHRLLLFFLSSVYRCFLFVSITSISIFRQISSHRECVSCKLNSDFLKSFYYFRGTDTNSLYFGRYCYSINPNPNPNPNR